MERLPIGTPLEWCPFCGGLRVMIVVGGHVQCDTCKQVVESCCQGGS